jgi:hypothetical protein
MANGVAVHAFFAVAPPATDKSIVMKHVVRSPAELRLVVMQGEGGQI